MERNGKNLLGGEKSPYLRGHAGNPVWWRPWGGDAIAAAVSGDVPIFLSIGYSTCHWCHVMEKESFEDASVAELINGSFIAVKVDREEHPDVDRLYMSAVQAMGQRGGWPLTVILTPSLRPFFGGTYFPRDALKRILAEAARLWRDERPGVERAGLELHDALKRMDGHAAPDATRSPGEERLRGAFRWAREHFDVKHGGFGGAPKFPPSTMLRLLLRIHRRTGNLQALHMAEHTLAAMARGGIYDHLGGGFARYSTDARWCVPHFEKMLYDNALLATAYTEAFCATGEPMYSMIARETLDYVLREMTSPGGGFYSAQDADSGGREGSFYVWTAAGIRSALSEEDYGALCRVYEVSEGGNFGDGFNVLAMRESAAWEDRCRPDVASALSRLRGERSNREHPLKDDKILTAWNGLMIGAMARAYRVFGDPAYLDAAVRSASFVRDALWKAGVLLRRYRDGDARHQGTLDDYAYMVEGLIALYEATGDERWLSWAAELQGAQDRVFLDERGGAYFYSSGDTPHLIVRTRELSDGALPAANAVSALNNLRLHRYMRDETFLENALGVFAAAGDLPLRYPGAFAQMLMAEDFLTDDVLEITVAGDTGSREFTTALRRLSAHFMPNVVLACAGTNMPARIPLAADKTPQVGRTVFYVCGNGLCHPPLDDIAAVIALTGSVKRYEL